MNTILPNYQRTHSSMASRKRVAADVSKKPKPVFPTSSSPTPPTSSNVERMSIADSAILRASLTQSRFNWTHGAFTKFTPEPAARNQGQQGGKRYLSEVTPAGIYTVCIGPHMFFETKFFTVYTPPPPAPPQTSVTVASSPSTTTTADCTSPLPSVPTAGGLSSGNTAASTPTDLPSSPIHMIPGGSPAPERVIELILARTSTPTPFEEEGKETDGGARSLPSELAGQRELETTLMESIQTLEPVVMDSNKNNIAHVHGGATIGAGSGSGHAADNMSSSSRAGTPGLGSSGSGSGSGAVGGVGSSTSSSMSVPSSKKTGGAGGQQQTRPPRPERQVAFEFKDNPGHRWLFPQEASVDFTPAAEGSTEYGKISASFCLPVYDDNKMPIPPGQMTTMVIVGPSQSLYEGILAAVNDPTVTYKALMDKMKHIPPRAYPEYQLPVEYPDERLEPLGLKKLPDHKVVPLASLQPSKRKPDGQQDIPPSKQKKARASSGVPDETSTSSGRLSGSQKKMSAAPSAVSSSAPVPAAFSSSSSTPAAALSSSSSTASLTKRCVYCGCTTTPMWRRGPAGPSTLCNACGVKWKNGKILQETPKPPSTKPKQHQQTLQHGPMSTLSSSSVASAAAAASSLSASASATKSAAMATSSPTTKASIASSSTVSAASVTATSTLAAGTTAASGGSQKTTVEAAAELLKNFVEAVNNPRQNGILTQPMSRSSSVRGSSSRRTAGGGGGANQHTAAAKRDASHLSENSMTSESEGGSRITEAEKMVPVKKRHSSKAQTAAASLAASTSSSSLSNSPSSQGPKLVPVAQIGEQQVPAPKGAKSTATSVKKESGLSHAGASKLSKANISALAAAAAAAAEAASTSASGTSDRDVSSGLLATSNVVLPSTPVSTPMSAATSATTSPTTPSAPVTVIISTPTSSSTTTNTATASSKGKATATSKTAASRTTGAKGSSSSSPSTSTTSGARGAAAKAKANGATVTSTTTTTAVTNATSTASTASTPRPSPPTSAGAKLELLKALANSPRYQISHAAAVSTMNLADDGLSLFATKNLYTNNTATFPLHFPTISIAFGPNNAYYTYPNCAVILYENHFQIKLIQSGERTQIDVWKEGIEGTEFQVVDVGDGESMIVFRAMLRQYMTRFDKELLNPDRNETLIVFRFRERLDGGGPPVKPLLEQWLTTEIPVAPPPPPPAASSPSSSAAQLPSKLPSSTSPSTTSTPAAKAP